ncbi:hypothetical protein [Rahnella aceris]|uniref:hypothetical protein n=1 Tax=Rahnella sp. (strain Y9602) TaxID=2703885 RepID=UPI00366404D7
MSIQNTPENDTGTDRTGTTEALPGTLWDPAARKFVNGTLWATIKKIPIAGDMLEILGEVFEGLADQEREFRHKRLVEYILGVAAIHRADLDIQDDDLLVAIRRVIQDDEAGKARYYARLTVMMVESNVELEEKIHFLNMLSALACSQIAYAREFYIRDTIPLCGYPDCDSAVRELISQGNGRNLRARSNLVSWGLLQEEQLPAGLDSASGIVYKRTEDLDKLITFLFSENDRQPDVIDKTQKEAFDVIIVDHLKSTDDLYLTHLSSRLESAGLTVDVVERVSDHHLQKTARLYVWNNKLIKSSASGPEKDNIVIRILNAPPLVGGPSPRDTGNGSFSLTSDAFYNAGNHKHRRSGSTMELVSLLDAVADNLISALTQ